MGLKHKQLLKDYKVAKNKLCGIGIEEVKNRLEKFSKHDNKAKAYKLLLEAIVFNTIAKDFHRKGSNRFYKIKDMLLEKLIRMCNKYHYNVGWHESDIEDKNYIVYFQLPNCKQISFHTDVNVDNIPMFHDDWDGIINSSIWKIEEAILVNYPSINL